ncbi:hypothetical protein HRI_004176500 [Hibiscus trionum]|uniref:KIB1-4 beta-propeller domain-containing protein n=1 Tax=Hibiscus trionum TaxID=183268 RepID=A0A9W7IYW8_HIBTR|nr:hypothetical protein HRI_004176500 [Hibiscus trionum]
MRAVCKAWSFASPHVPPRGDDKLPLAMEFRWRPGPDSQVHGECRLLDPLSGDSDYVAEESVRGSNFHIFLDVILCATAYGWVLFFGSRFFLYSPFTTEVIKLPEFEEQLSFSLATISLKCVIFVLYNKYKKIHIMLCSPCDSSWKTFEFNAFGQGNRVVDVTYANGVYYCVFREGQLGAFNLEHKEWTILVEHAPLPGFNFHYAKLFSCDGHLRLLSCEHHSNLVKLDLPKMHWVFEKDLNGHVLFIGCTSLCAPAVGESSQLANIIISSRVPFHPAVRWHGYTSLPRSPLIYGCVAAGHTHGRTWIELPLRGIWRANDLIHAI